MGALPFALVFVIPLCTAMGFVFGGAWTFLTVVYVFGVTPALDACLGLETKNPEDDRPGSPLFDAWLYAFVPIQLGMTIWGLYLVAFVPHAPYELVGITLSVGLVNGAGGINIAHELMHRSSRLARATAELLMSTVTYTHFCVEHVHGHHKHVATPRDPASSRQGESVYAFVPRSLLGGLLSAWRIEGERVRRVGISRFSLKNRQLRYPLLLAVIYAAVYLGFGVSGAAMFLAQGAVGFLLLEVINYIEHYGLERREIAPGKYERVLPKHSWNSAHRLSGWYLFNLPRHSDHHFLASRPYWSLRHHEDSPQLPAGYATMLLVALLPPLWHRIMDARVAAWNQLEAAA